MNRFTFLLLCVFAFANSFAQTNQGDLKAYTYLTIYFVDNSDGADADALNDDMVQAFKESLNKLTMRPDNYFFFYGSDGDENKTSSNLTSFINSPLMKKYLANPSREAEFMFDKNSIRDYFTESPVKVKQDIEINIFLSTYAAKRMIKDMEDLPVTVFLASEFPLYINATDKNNFRMKINYFINKEAKESVGEEKIVNFINFCSKELNQKINSEIKFL